MAYPAKFGFASNAAFRINDQILQLSSSTMQNQKHTIGFNEKGICDACKMAEAKSKEIDWDERRSPSKAMRQASKS